MRIISGNLKSRVFAANIPNNVRPTTDSHRETVFNILNNYIDFNNINVADFCAGTGALGFESISRGAEYCMFVEVNRVVAKYIEKQASAWNIPDIRYDIINEESLKFLKSVNKGDLSFDIIFLDPPYDLNLNQKIINSALEKDIISDGGIIVSESSSKFIYNLPDNLEKIASKILGETKIEFFINHK